MEKIKNEIRNYEKKLLDAIRNCDADALEALIHDNLLFNLPDGKTKTKAFDIATYRSGNMKVKSAVASDMELRVIDETTAVVAVTVTLDAQYYDLAIAGQFRYLRVWKSSAGQWKIIAGSCVALG